MLDMITAQEFVKVGELSEAFRISDVTVRTDLDVLDRTKLVRRVHGGAVPRRRNLVSELSFEEAAAASSKEKQRIGVAAAAMVTSGMSVLIDVGTTTTAIARAMAARTELQDVVVITSAVNIAMVLEQTIPRFTVMVTGGTLRPLQHSLVAPLAGEVLSKVHADIAFLGCNGVEPDQGITNVNLPETEVKVKMLAAAATAVVVADSSKLGQVHLGHVARLDQIDTLITGAAADKALLGRFEASGLQVQLA